MKLVFCILVLAAASFAQNTTIQPGVCTGTAQNFKINYAWVPGQTIPYGMIFELWNPLGSGCDIYISKITLSDGLTANSTYLEFGLAWANSLMPGCTQSQQTVNLIFPFGTTPLPGGVIAIGLPCGTYISIGTITDGRWLVGSGQSYEEKFEIARFIPSGKGYSVWTTPGGYPVIQSATGDLVVTIEAKFCSTGVQC